MYAYEENSNLSCHITNWLLNIYHFSLGFHYYTWSKDFFSSFRCKHYCKYWGIITSCLKWYINTSDEYSWVHSHTNKTTARNKWATNPYLIVHQENLCVFWSKEVCIIISTRRMLLKWKIIWQYYGFGIVVNRYINNFSNVIDKNLGRAREHLLIKCCINLLSLLFLDHSLMIYKIDDHHIR